MKWIRYFSRFVILLVFSLSACSPDQIFGPTPSLTLTITQTPTPTYTPTITPTLTLTPTLTPTPIPPLIALMNQAKSKNMFVVILLTPNAIVEDFFSEVEVVEGYSAQELLEPVNPDLYQRIMKNNYFSDYFKVVLVGNADCEGHCTLYAENGRCDNLYCYKPLYNGQGMLHINYYYYGTYLVYWQPAENQMCAYDPAYTWCSTAKK